MDGHYTDSPIVSFDSIDYHDVDDLDSLCTESDAECDMLDSYITGVCAIHAARSTMYDHLTAKVWSKPTENLFPKLLTYSNLTLTHFSGLK